MTTARTDFPPVRACLFDMDGLLLNTEDLYTIATNIMLEKHGRPRIPWSIKAQLQGRPGPAAGKIFQDWAKLPIPHEQYRQEVSELQLELFPSAEPLPGVVELLQKLGRAGVDIALATSSHKANFELKTRNHTELFSIFPARRRVLGDDPRIPVGKGKPAPEIYLLALKMVNETLKPGETPIKPEECLVFEDSVPGVESGRRAGMRVIWCPHPELKDLFAGKEGEVLAGRADEHTSKISGGQDDPSQLRGEIGDGWAQYLTTLENFPYATYGIPVPETKKEEKL